MTPSATRARWVGFIAVIALASTSAPALQTRPDSARLPRLDDIFTAGGPVLRDRNGDGVIDFVDAQFALADSPTDVDVAAAANLAARFGHESAELNLPLPAEGGRVSVAIGTGGIRKLALSDDAVGLTGLLPAEGLVTVAGTPERPVLVVAGRDDAGTRAASEFAAARLPYAWDVKGVTLSQVESDVATVVGATTGCAVAPSPVVIVRLGGDAIERVVTRVTCETPALATGLLTALRTLRRSAAAPQRAPSPSAPSTAAAAAGTPASPMLDYAGIRLMRFELRAPGAPPRVVDLPRLTAPPAAPLGRRPGPAKDSLDLSTLYEIDGLLGDSDSNLIPDRTDILLVPAGPGTRDVLNLAARIGLESAGVSLPLVVTPAALDKPATEPTLVLIGVTHPLIEQLIAEKKFDRAGLKPGEGVIRVIRKAFGDKSAVVISGADRAGLGRAIGQAAERLPHLWPRGKDRPTLEDVEEDVRRFVSGRSPSGQAAIGMYKLNQLLRVLAGKDLTRASVRISVNRPDAGLAVFLKQQVLTGLTADAASGPRVAPENLDVTVEGLDVRSAIPVLVNGQPVGGEFDVASEVDDFWTAFRTRVLPVVKKNATVHVEARLSEPRTLRRGIERDARDALLKAGAATASTVTVLSAYKQGYSWLDEVVKPQLTGKDVAQVRIRFAEAGPPPEWKQQAMFIPTRWLHEIFPIDEILARDLKLDLKHIVVEKAPVGSPTYEVTATDTAGGVIYRGSFEPATLVRPYFDRFPDYEHVRVTTGWVSASVNGVSLVSQRITTDLERFWNVFQSRTLPAIYDYVMAQSDGKPRVEDAPHFGELRVEVSLSEPHEKLGVDQEQISPMEALHEDVYFGVLHFFDVMGRITRGAALDYPGHIVPVMRPTADGKAGRARITFTGFGAPRPMAAIDYTERNGTTGRVKLDIPAIAVDRPSAVGVVVSHGTDGIDRLDVRVKVDTEVDERAALVARARAERVDQQILSAEQVTWSLAALSRLQSAGLYTDALAYHGLRELQVTAGWTHDPAPDAQRTALLAADGTAPPLPDIRQFLPVDADPAAPGPPAVQWTKPMPPAEAYGVLATMAPFREAAVYKAGETYLGQDIWAMDLTSPILSSHWSQAKATTWKPTAMFSGRQHANEVSSTSHILKLAERVLTVPEHRKWLDKVNIVIHPVTNADGAQLAHELWADTPDFMMHAAYLGSLGVDVTTAQWDADGIYPESKIRAQLWRTWLPDLFLNPHGYPSHEWVQPFSEYAAWVRSRVTEGRDWWGMRGWFMPGFAFIDDPKYPRHKDAAMEIRRRITAAINGLPAVKALNERAYDRYRRYGFAWNQEDFKQDFTDGVLIYTAIKGGKPNPRGADPMARQPNITIWSGVTEAPDEPAYGDWLNLVASAGLAWDEAMVAYLAEGKHEVERKRDAFWGGVTLSLSRARPPKAGD